MLSLLPRENIHCGLSQGRHHPPSIQPGVVGAVVQHMEDDRSRIVETDGLTETETYCLQSRGHNERVAILPSSLVVVNF